jgi:hypothetical protein
VEANNAIYNARMHNAMVTKGQQKLSSFKLLSKPLKIKIYKYVFENNVLRSISEYMRAEISGQYKNYTIRK